MPENDVVSAPAPTEVDKLHDSLLSGLSEYAKAPTPEAFKPIQETLGKYSETRTKFLGDLKTFQDAEAKKNAVPEKYVFEMPKDSPLGEDYTKTVETIAKEKKLTQAQAQALLVDRDQTVRNYQEIQTKKFQAALDASAEKIKSHPTFGGANLAKTEERVTQVIKKFGNEKVMDTMKKAGAFTDPDIVELLWKIADTIGDDRLTTPKFAPTAKELAGAGTDRPPAGFSEVAGAKK